PTPHAAAIRMTSISLPWLVSRVETAFRLSGTRPPPKPTLFPYTTLFRSQHVEHRQHVLLPEPRGRFLARHFACRQAADIGDQSRSEEHTSELQSPCKLVCRPLLEKKNGGRLPAGARARARHRGRGYEDED